MKIKKNDKAPEFSLPNQAGEIVKLSDYKNQWLLVYFYPKDNTSGCTKEACGIRDYVRQFQKSNLQVVGVSIDSVKSHKNFADKYKLKFPLLSDENKEMVRRYGVWGKKKFMGREYMGTNRMSFLIDPKGRIAKVYLKVKPEGHAQEVIRDVNELCAT